MYNFVQYSTLYVIAFYQYINKILLLLKFHMLFLINCLIDIVITDNPLKQLRFSLIYLLSSTIYNYKMIFLFQIAETTLLQSITLLYPSAKWLEREIWDLFGIFFLMNKDMRRILNDYGFVGYPLRKDFPLVGFFEVEYNDLSKQIVYQDNELLQVYKNYAFIPV
jgi:NADH:ubiquinone oxidoreductase subunit C